MAATRQAELGRELLALHHGPDVLVIPNAWDPGSARILEQVGFPALATTSAGIAFSLGRPDGTLDRDTALDRAAAIVAAVEPPVTVDLEAGYGEDPAAVGMTIAAAVAFGAAGANIEDSQPGGAGLFPAEEAAARLAAARAAAPAGTFVLNARIDTYLTGTDDPRGAALARAARYVEAGADCIFVPGVDDPDELRALAAGISVPLNAVAGLTGASADVATLGALGVRRITVGGSLTRAALTYVERAATELREHGTFGFTADAVPYGELQRRFGPS